jgi:hypothetical protein
VSPAGAAALGLFALGAVVLARLDRLSPVDALYASAGVVSCVGVVARPGSATSRLFVALLNAASLGVGAAAIGEIGEARVAAARELLAHRSRGGRSAVAGAGAGAGAVARGAELRALLLWALPLLGAGALAFAWLEDWPLGSALYVAFTCASGLGFSEGLELSSWRAKLFFVAWIAPTMSVTLGLLSLAGTAVRGAVEAALSGGGKGRGSGGGGGVVTSSADDDAQSAVSVRSY